MQRECHKKSYVSNFFEHIQASWISIVDFFFFFFCTLKIFSLSDRKILTPMKHTSMLDKNCFTFVIKTCQCQHLHLFSILWTIMLSLCDLTHICHSKSNSMSATSFSTISASKAKYVIESITSLAYTNSSLICNRTQV